MITTIQVNDKTLELLRRLKEELKTSSYEEAIAQVILNRNKRKSMAGQFSKYYKNQSLKKILKDLRDKNERF